MPVVVENMGMPVEPMKEVNAVVVVIVVKLEATSGTDEVVCEVVEIERVDPLELAGPKLCNVLMVGLMVGGILSCPPAEGATPSPGPALDALETGPFACPPPEVEAGGLFVPLVPVGMAFSDLFFSDPTTPPTTTAIITATTTTTIMMIPFVVA